jgi:hypothetical protein
MRTAGIGILALWLSWGADARGQESSPAPLRSAGEVKAMLQMLAPGKGASPQEVYLARVRQYRYLCGVPFEGLRYDGRQGELAHAAADICAKLNKLTHSPERPAGMSDAAYELGKRGAGTCNLYRGRVEPASCVDGWMDDSDPSNIDRVGHRRWILNPRMGTSAFGTVGDYAAMYAFDASNKDVPEWDFVAYPAPGMMPVQYFGDRHAWSVSPNLKRYTVPAQVQVKVSLHAADAKGEPAGEPLKLDYFRVDTGGFGSGTAIIFRPAPFGMAHGGHYAVRIDGLQRDGEAAVIRYAVNFVSLQRIPDGPEASVVYTKYLQGRLDSIQALPEPVDRLESIGDFLEIEQLRAADPKLRIAAQKSLTELLKEPALKREHDASQKLKLVKAMEQKAGGNKRQLLPVAASYQSLARAYKETRAGTQAAADFERLKSALQ